MKMFKLRKPIVILITILLAITLTACGRDVLQDAVDEINSDRELHEELSGLYTVRAEKRGESAIVVIFRAELEELATTEISRTVAEGGAKEFGEAVNEMRKARIVNPEVILEFFDLSGVLIYTHVFD